MIPTANGSKATSMYRSSPCQEGRTILRQKLLFERYLNTLNHSLHSFPTRSLMPSWSLFVCRSRHDANISSTFGVNSSKSFVVTWDRSLFLDCSESSLEFSFNTIFRRAFSLYLRSSNTCSVGAQRCKWTSRAPTSLNSGQSLRIRTVKWLLTVDDNAGAHFELGEVDALDNECIEASDHNAPDIK